MDLQKVRNFCNKNGIKMDEDFAERLVFIKGKDRKVLGPDLITKIGTTEKMIDMLKKEFC